MKEVQETLTFVRGNLEVSYTHTNGKQAESVLVYERPPMPSSLAGTLISYSPPSIITLKNPAQVRDLIAMLTDVLDGAYE